MDLLLHPCGPGWPWLTIRMMDVAKWLNAGRWRNVTVKVLADRMWAASLDFRLRIKKGNKIRVKNGAWLWHRVVQMGETQKKLLKSEVAGAEGGRGQRAMDRGQVDSTWKKAVCSCRLLTCEVWQKQVQPKDGWQDVGGGKPCRDAEGRIRSVRDDWMKERERERERGLLPGLQWKQKGR